MDTGFWNQEEHTALLGNEEGKTEGAAEKGSEKHSRSHAT